MKTLDRILVLLLIIPIVTNCKDNRNEVNQQFENCVNNSILQLLNDKGKFTEHKLTKKENFNFFDTIRRFEKKMIQNKLLNNNSKKEYKNLISLIRNEKISSEKISLLKNNNSFLMYSTRSLFSSLTIYNNCPLKIIKKAKSRRLASFKDVYDKIQGKGFSNFASEIEEYSKLIDYKSDIERLQMTYLIYIYFNTTFWNPREFPETNLKELATYILNHRNKSLLPTQCIINCC